LDEANQRVPVQHSLTVPEPTQFAQVPLEDVAGDGKQLRLGDVGTVGKDYQPIIGDAIINGGPGLLLVVEKFPWGNTLEVTKGVEDALKELQPGLSDVHFDTTIFRPATFIDDSINNLSDAL